MRSSDQGGTGKTVFFVIGPPNAGKTTARKADARLSALPYVDLADVQNALYKDNGEPATYETVWRSYEIALEELLELMEDNDEVVFEHTLVKEHRRPYYIDGIRERFPGARLACLYVLPDAREYMRRGGMEEDEIGPAMSLLRDGDGESGTGAQSTLAAARMSLAKYLFTVHSMFDVPADGEGFDEVRELGS